MHVRAIIAGEIIHTRRGRLIISLRRRPPTRGAGLQTKRESLLLQLAVRRRSSIILHDDDDAD